MTRYLSAGVSTAAALWAIPLRRLWCAVVGHRVYRWSEVGYQFAVCLRCSWEEKA